MFFHLTSLNRTAWRNLDIWNYHHIEIPVFFVTHATFVLRMGSLIPSHIPILVHVLSVQHSLVCVCHLWLCGCKCVFPRGYSLCRTCSSRRGLDTFYWLSSIQLSALPSYLPHVFPLILLSSRVTSSTQLLFGMNTVYHTSIITEQKVILLCFFVFRDQLLLWTWILTSLICPILILVFLENISKNGNLGRALWNNNSTAKNCACTSLSLCVCVCKSLCEATFRYWHDWLKTEQTSSNEELR